MSSQDENHSLIFFLPALFIMHYSKNFHLSFRFFISHHRSNSLSTDRKKKYFLHDCLVNLHFFISLKLLFLFIKKDRITLGKVKTKELQESEDNGY